MNNTKKPWLAVMISLLVMPGFGHVYVGKKVKGYLISLAVCLILLALFILFERELLHQTTLLADSRMILTRIFPLAKKAWLVHERIFLGGLGLLGLIWIFAAVDVARKG